MISIHALRKESDSHAGRHGYRLAISIHALRKESDGIFAIDTHAKTISIHALRKESDRYESATGMLHDLFQSTLSVRRATKWLQSRLSHSKLFQSTLSVRRATMTENEARARFTISIHALRKESDRCRRSRSPMFRNFNPRSP